MLNGDLRDLSTPSAVQEYLKDTVFASHTVTALSGGLCNFTFRLHLVAQHQGHSTYVLKYAAPYVAFSAGTMPFTPERQNFEAGALRLVEKLQPGDGIVTAPVVHHLDDVAHVMIIDDCGEDTRTLKQSMIDGLVSPAMAEEIGCALGRFIGRIHSWTKDPSVDLSLFETNDEAKEISGFISYGRLTSTLTGKDDIPALSDPPIDISQTDLQVISDLAAVRIQAINTTTETFTHGDFWPGNIMVSLRTDPEGGISPKLEKLYVLDWEATKTGLRGLDLGQFCAEIHLLRRFHANCEEPASVMLESFLRTYGQNQDVDVALARTALTHVGAHLVAWGPRVKWGGREETRAIVKEGADLLAKGAFASEEWLQSQLIGPLLQSSNE
ncbi:hypothetical protein BV22DRAFT_1014458 [Leucogyrophana mollusca]|uniref:Uncharacterized protein n=1 Tax=Leucogyrophana mollusca TaxID=85980 RepID=A0ACB8BDU6_9AGAM|nr:hypothetical protein BV22DRAFT_1014458 [Leucogyrophana mollusca]